MSLMLGGGKPWSTLKEVTKTIRMKPTHTSGEDENSIYTVKGEDVVKKLGGIKVVNSYKVYNQAHDLLKEVKPSGTPNTTVTLEDITMKGASTSVNEFVIIEVVLPVKSGTKLEINADSFPGTYKIVGDTYARNRNTGKDENFQFVINRAKISSEETLTLEAEGDPTTFNLNARVLRPVDGAMFELKQYDLGLEDSDTGSWSSDFSAQA